MDVEPGEFAKAARLCPKVCGQDIKRWEDWIFVFVQKHQLQVRATYCYCSRYSSFYPNRLSSHMCPPKPQR